MHGCKGCYESTLFANVVRHILVPRLARSNDMLADSVLPTLSLTVLDVNTEIDPILLSGVSDESKTVLK